MRRSSAALAVGLVALGGAWLFGSRALAPVGIGLVAAALAARAWRRGAGTSVSLVRRVSAARLVEGDALTVELRLSGGLATWLPAVAREQLGTLGPREVRIRRGRGRITVEDVPRGRHVLGPARVVLRDPLGLERVEVGTATTGVVLVRPRVAAVQALFTDTGRDGFGARRAILRRPAGVDLHSVRDYQEGEPLRLVHWPTTARRGTLTVRELQDAPRDETVVVLDCDPAGVVGEPGRSSFDEAVRAAAAIVHAAVRRGRPVALVAGGGPESLVRVSAADGSFDAALDVLAATEPDGGRSLAAVLADRRLAAARAPELLLVTCRPEAAATAALLGRDAGGVVVIDAPTYVGAPPSPPSTVLLRLAAAGIPVAIVRRGDDLAAVLGGVTAGARTA